MGASWWGGSARVCGRHSRMDGNRKPQTQTTHMLGFIELYTHIKAAQAGKECKGKVCENLSSVVCGWVPVGEYAARSSFAVARGSLHAVCRDEIPFRRGANRLVCFGIRS